mmetsp:Transcript_71022/g.112881  ORF Transcript_71022/g.112881 Transcript_71022/m.112881 type:complete len:408 (-) Transcript_71022:9-1232(-)
MYCGEEYIESCSISPDGLSCRSGDGVCRDDYQDPTTPPTSDGSNIRANFTLEIEVNGVGVQNISNVINQTINEYIKRLSVDYTYTLQVDTVSRNGTVSVQILIISDDEIPINQGDLIRHSQEEFDDKYGEGKVTILSPFSTTDERDETVKTDETNKNGRTAAVLLSIAAICVVIFVSVMIWRFYFKARKEESTKPVVEKIDSASGPYSSDGEQVELENVDPAGDAQTDSPGDVQRVDDTDEKAETAIEHVQAVNSRNTANFDSDDDMDDDDVVQHLTAGDETKREDDEAVARKHEEVREWISIKVGLARCFELFVSNGYGSLESIKEIKNKAELKQIGVGSEDEQNAIMQAIRNLREGNVCADDGEFIVADSDEEQEEDGTTRGAGGTKEHPDELSSDDSDDQQTRK